MRHPPSCGPSCVLTLGDYVQAYANNLTRQMRLFPLIYRVSGRKNPKPRHKCVRLFELSSFEPRLLRRLRKGVEQFGDGHDADALIALEGEQVPVPGYDRRRFGRYGALEDPI